MVNIKHAIKIYEKKVLDKEILYEMVTQFSLIAEQNFSHLSKYTQ